MNNIILVAISHHRVYTRDARQGTGSSLGVTTGHNHARLGILPPQSASQLTHLLVGATRHRAGVHHNHVSLHPLLGFLEVTGKEILAESRTVRLVSAAAKSRNVKSLSQCKSWPSVSAAETERLQ